MAMKHNENNERIQTPEKSERTRENKTSIKAVPRESALAALHASLLTGGQAPLSAEQATDAAGTLGNQNVLELMEAGAGLQRAISGAGTDMDTQGLAKTLSGPPDGPVCAMEAFFQE
jgi:hypothetical protein